jgi:phage host-nuclease inhibitor protein Gam
MEQVLKEEVKKEINRIVDLMVQADSIRESIAELKKDIKNEYAIPVATITKVATIIRKQNLDEEEAKWDEIKEWVDICS